MIFTPKILYSFVRDFLTNISNDETFLQDCEANEVNSEVNVAPVEFPITYILLITKYRA